MQKLIMKHKNYLLFVVIVIAIGILVGILYYQFLNQSMKDSVITTLKTYQSFNYNNTLKDLIVMSLLLITSFFVIGFPFGIFYLFYEGISLGFLLNIFYVTYKFKGIIYFLLHFLVNKLLILILLIFFIKRIINISRYTIGYLVYRHDNAIKEKIFNNFKKSLYTIMIVLVINIILYFISPVIFNNLKFLLK